MYYVSIPKNDGSEYFVGNAFGGTYATPEEARAAMLAAYRAGLVSRDTLVASRITYITYWPF